MDNLMYAKGKAAYLIEHGFPVVDHFYSDSLADTPLALCAEKAHLITDKARRVNDRPYLDEETLKKVHRKIDTRGDTSVTSRYQLNPMIYGV